MAYSPGRWSYEARLVAASLYPFVSPMEPPEWSAVLDRLDQALRVSD
jgi:hypothetical protein